MTIGTDDATLRLETISRAVPLPVASPDETLRLTAVDATQRLETIPRPGSRHRARIRLLCPSASTWRPTFSIWPLSAAWPRTP